MTADSAIAGLGSVAEHFGLTVVQETNSSALGTNGLANEPEPTTHVITGSIDDAKHIYKGPVDLQGEFTWVDTYPDNVEEAAENEETAKHAVVVRNKKSSDSRKKFEVDSLVIQSPWLKKALGEILKGYPGICCDLDRLVFDAPFAPFVHRWGDLLDFMKQRHDAKTDTHMEVLFEILKAELGNTTKAFNDYVARGVITFEHLWTIFQPGAIVLSHFHGGSSVAVQFQSGSYEETRCGNVYALSCECVDWNGQHFGKGSENLQIPEFSGTRQIRSLHAYPLAFHPKKEAFRDLLIKRGKKFEALIGYQYKEYKGFALGIDSEGKEICLSVTGRIVLDAQSWNRRNPMYQRHLEPMTIPAGEEGNEHVVFPEESRASVHGMVGSANSSQQLQEEHHLICSPRLKGYSLKLKRWLKFFVDLVHDIKFDDRAFESLVLPQDQKELVLAFAESQVANRADFDDVIQGKGKGMIMLLSGPPGVGKTLTAESIAESMHVPLYTMSAGDLGSAPHQVEMLLREIFEMVAKWNAILLLDECDVFLEARSAHDLERNKLVSIFLRVLEYYEGILFLTTNRVNNIDAAFQSRIHVSMAYPDLTTESRRHIWANFLAGSAREHEFSETDLNELALVELNGRQIKNVLKMAQLLASRKKCNLRREFVETILAIERRRPEIRS